MKPTQRIPGGSRGVLLAAALMGSLAHAAGAPDPTFGTRGLVRVPLVAPETFSSLLATVELPDGRIVAGGGGGPGGFGGALYRFLPDGRPDASFGPGGRVELGLPGVNSIEHLHLLPDGAVLAGNPFALSRLSPAGQSDRGFGRDGVVATLRDIGVSARALLVARDGSVLLVGGLNDREFADYGGGALARLLLDGSIDRSFVVQNGAYFSSFPGADLFYGAALDPQQRIVAVGPKYSSNSTRCIVARAQPDGLADAAFGRAGLVEGPVVAIDNRCGPLTVQPDGRIVFAAERSVLRLTADGRPDESFGRGGAYTLPDGIGEVSGLAIAPDGGIFVFGAVRDASVVQVPFVVRLSSGGVPAADFGVAGVLRVDLGDPDPRRSVQAPRGRLLPSGKLLLAGGDRSGYLLRIDPVAAASRSTLGLASGAALREAAVAAELRVERIGAGVGPASVAFRTASGSALAGEDFVPTTGTLAWADGELGARTIRVPILDDAADEGDEQFEVELATPTGQVDLAAARVAVRIAASDGSGATRLAATVRGNDLRVSEIARFLTVLVRREGSVVGEAAAEVIVTPATADARVAPVTATLKWADGDSIERQVAVPIANDFVRTGDLDLAIRLRSLDPAVPIAPASFAVTIVEDDVAVATFGPSATSNSSGGGGALGPGLLAALALLLALSSSRAHASGAPDPTFGTRGIVRVPLVAPETFAFLGAAIELPDGRVLAGGWRGPGNLPLVLYRFLPDGRPDAAFGPGGRAEPGVAPIGALQHLELRSDGSVLAGSPYQLFRLSPGGQLDRRFGANGEVLLLRDAGVSGHALLPTGDGRFVLAGGLSDGDGGDYGGGAVGRLLADGVADPSLKLPRTTSSADGAYPDVDQLLGAVLDPQRRIVAAGPKYSPTIRCVVTRLLADGTADATFGRSGVVEGPVTANGNRCGAVAVQPDGRVLFAAERSVLRLTADGRPDASFAQGGTYLLPDGIGEVSSLAIAPDGGIVLFGARRVTGRVQVPFVARLSNAGVPVAGFGSGGLLRIDLGEVDSRATSGEGHPRGRLLPSGKLLIAGGDYAGYLLRIDPAAPSRSSLGLAGGAGLREVAATADLSVERIGTGVGPASVAFRTVAGSALAGEDFVPTTGTLAWADGELGARTIRVPILDDAADEGDEQFEVELATPTGQVDLAAARVAVRIAASDGERATAFSLAPAVSLDVSESARFFRYVVRREGSAIADASVRVVVTAAPGSTRVDTVDRAAAPRLIFGEGGSAIYTLSVPIRDDALRNGDETFTLELSEPSDGVPLRSARLTVTVRDDDAPATSGAATAGGTAGSGAGGGGRLDAYGLALLGALAWLARPRRLASDAQPGHFGRRKLATRKSISARTFGATWRRVT